MILVFIVIRVERVNFELMFLRGRRDGGGGGKEREEEEKGNMVFFFGFCLSLCL